MPSRRNSSGGATGGDVVIDPGDEAFEPVARVVRQSLDDRRHGAADVDRMNGPVERQRPRPEHFGEAALRDAPQHLHLRQPQMGVYQTEGDGEVAIALCFDERDEMLVPADLDRRRDRRVAQRKRTTGARSPC